MKQNQWRLIDWDGNPALKLKCWRKKFGHGHVSVGAGEFLTIVYSYGANSEDSLFSTRWRADGRHLSEEQAMAEVDANNGKAGPKFLRLPTIFGLFANMLRPKKSLDNV